ncbi:hypothetical protein AVEN_221123-1 [Araneus ventricosus]|uniref:Uncharacterized protein n=1 Tax=Araneus ventricosus TaxID=182803 RepID=A0A4Y2U6P3_ARAVE|nr:hypothetical protein AVEN_221123-1 [Araneus ventricosus]
MNKSSPLKSVNISAGILGDYVVSPHILPDRLTGATYRIFLEQGLPSLLQAVPLPIQRDMWFMHDGTPAHISSTVWYFLIATYPAADLWLGLLTHRTSTTGLFLLGEA